MEQDKVDFEPPSAVDAARRAAILKYQIVHVATTPPRELVAQLSAEWSESDWNEFVTALEENRQKIVDALRSSGLWEDMSASERAIFECPALELTEQQVINTSWRAEVLGCLAWALGLVDTLPAYDTQMDPEQLLPLITVDDVAAFIRGAILRPQSQIERARDIAELWHWRSRTRELQERSYTPPPGQPELDQIVRELSPRAAADGMIPMPIDGDFPALGRAYRDLSPDEWANAESIAMERHLALNWLCGYAPDNEWDETPTDT